MRVRVGGVRIVGEQDDGWNEDEQSVSTKEEDICPECGGSEFIEDSVWRDRFAADGIIIRSNILDDCDVFQGVSNIKT